MKRLWVWQIVVLALAACSGADPSVATLPTPAPSEASQPGVTAASTIAPTPTAPPATPTLVPTTVAAPTTTAPDTPTPTLLPTDAPATTVVPAPAETLAPTAAPTGSTSGDPAPGGAVRPELAGKLAFVRGGDTWLYRPATGEVRELIAGATDARWSPDGRSLLFTRDDGIYLADAAGTNERRIHAGSGAFQPAWAPDGTKIAWTEGNPDGGTTNRQLWSLDLDNGAVSRVGQGMYPAWAPDSQRIAYVTLADGGPTRRTELRLVNWRGENDWPAITSLPPNTPPIGVPGSQLGPADLGHGMANPFWGADGRFVYVASFVAYQALSDFFIWERADATNGGSTYLGELWGSTATPAPDRQAVVFTASSARGDSWLETRALDGDDARWSWAQTDRGLTAVEPAWAPDGNALAYYRCDIEPPGPCHLELATPAGKLVLLPDVFGGSGPDWGGGLTLDWGRDA